MTRKTNTSHEKIPLQVYLTRKLNTELSIQMTALGLFSRSAYIESILRKHIPLSSTEKAKVISCKTQNKHKKQ